MLHSVLFYVFAAIMFGAALGVVFSRNPVHAVMFLVFTFFNAAILWLLAEAEFLAIVLVLVYVGAVMVLFLFVVMMLEVDVEAAKRGLTRYAPLGIALAFVMAIELVNVIWLRGELPADVGGFAPNPEGYSNTEALGAVLGRLRKKARRIVWLNPLKGWRDYAPVAASMQAALPHLDAHLPANTLEALGALEREFARL